MRRKNLLEEEQPLDHSGSLEIAEGTLQRQNQRLLER